QHRRSEGQDGGRAGSGRIAARLPRCHGRPRRARPDERHQLGHQPDDRPEGAFRRAEDRCFLGLSARAAGIARSKDRPCDRQQRDRPPVVAVLLLHAGRQPGIHPQESGGDQARAARHPQGDGPLRQRAGAGGETHGRRRIYAAIRLCAAGSEGNPVHEMARLRSRGHHALLFAATGRGRDDQVEPAEDHLAGDRLALLARAQEGAEDMSRAWSRRRFMSAASAAGTGALLGLRPGAAAAEPPPETTRLRIPWVPSTCRAPEWAAEDLLRAEGFTEVQYLLKDSTEGMARALATGEADIGGHFAAPGILRSEAGDPIVMLASERIRTIRDLQGRTVAVQALDPSPYAFLASMAAYVGLDPRKDINWVNH